MRTCAFKEIYNPNQNPHNIQLECNISNQGKLHVKTVFKHKMKYMLSCMN